MHLVTLLVRGRHRYRRDEDRLVVLQIRYYSGVLITFLTLIHAVTKQCWLRIRKLCPCLLFSLKDLKQSSSVQVVRRFTTYGLNVTH